MMKTNKIIFLSLLITLAIALLAYGAFFHSTNVLPQQDTDSAVLVKSEPQLIKEVTIGGVEKDELGNIKQTYSDPSNAPTACPT